MKEIIYEVDCLYGEGRWSSVYENGKKVNRVVPIVENLNRGTFRFSVYGNKVMYMELVNTISKLVSYSPVYVCDIKILRKDDYDSCKYDYITGEETKEQLEFKINYVYTKLKDIVDLLTNEGYDTENTIDNLTSNGFEVRLSENIVSNDERIYYEISYSNVNVLAYDLLGSMYLSGKRDIEVY